MKPCLLKQLIVLLIVILLSACSDNSGKQTDTVQNDKAVKQDQQKNTGKTDSKKNTVAPKGDKVAAVKSPAYLTTVFGVKRMPVADRKIDNPDGEGKVSNWVATLYRGEQVSSFEQNDKYTRVEDSTGKTGWIESRYLVVGEVVKPACVGKSLETFDRPDIISLNAKRVIKAGTLVFIIAENEQFVQVNFTPTQTAWVLKKNLVQDAKEIKAASFIEKMRYLKRKGKVEDIKKSLELMRSMMSETVLLKVAEAEFAEKKEVEKVATDK